MWHQIHDDYAAIERHKWVLSDERGRIIGRIVERDGEFKASKMEFDGMGVGTSIGKGAYVSLDQAKAAVEGE